MQMLKKPPQFLLSKASDVLDISFWLSGAALSLFSLCAVPERLFLLMASRAIWLLIIFDQQEALARDGKTEDK